MPSTDMPPSDMPETPSTPRLIPADRLCAAAALIFQGHGLSVADADCVAEALVEADLRGIHSHGLTRVPIYTERLARGLFNPAPAIQVERRGAAVASIDGDSGMGAVVGFLSGMFGVGGRHAVETAAEIAAEAGAAVVGVRHTNHFGIAALYAEALVQRGLVAIVCSNAPPTMAPHGGRQALFGTNPLAFGIPTPGPRPVLADMATSIVARGKIILARQRGETIPLGWALDSDGRPTGDAEAALAGVVLPFGGAKGSAIALLVDMLAGVLTGARYGTDLPDFYEDLTRKGDLGNFLLAIDPGRFMTAEAFLKRVGRYIEMMDACPTAEGVERILLPGEIEASTRDHRLADGVPLTPDIIAGMTAAADRVGVKLDF